MLPGRYGGSSIEFLGQLFTDPATKFETSFISCTNKCGHHLNIFSIQTTKFSPSNGSHFQVRYETCQVYDESKCEFESIIVSSHIIDHL